MKNKSKKSGSKKTVKHHENRYNQSDKNRRPLKEQEIAQEGNVENLESDEVTSR